MLQPGSFLAIAWWATYTVIGVWAQKALPGVDFLAPGIILSMQEQAGHRTFWLAIVWILLLEGMGNLPFGYGVAWYGLLVTLYIVGRWLFEARSILFMCLLGAGLGVLHPLLAYSLARLGNLSISMDQAVTAGMMQAVAFPLVWLIADKLFPKRLRHDVRPL